MKYLPIIILFFFILSSCVSQDEIQDFNLLTFDELEKLVLKSPSWQKVIDAADILYLDGPSPLNFTEREQWNQIFIDFHKEVGDDQYFSFYIDNPRFETPSEVRNHYLLLIDFQEKVEILKEDFGLTHVQFSDIFIKNRILPIIKN